MKLTQIPLSSQNTAQVIFDLQRAEAAGLPYEKWLESQRPYVPRYSKAHLRDFFIAYSPELKYPPSPDILNYQVPNLSIFQTSPKALKDENRTDRFDH